MPLIAVRNEDYEFLKRCHHTSGDSMGSIIHDSLILYANQGDSVEKHDIVEEKTVFIPRVKTLEDLRAEARKRKEQSSRCRTAVCSACSYWDNCGRYLCE